MTTESPPLSLLPTEDELGPAMAQSLAALLNQVRGAREVLPHLAALENGLQQHGSAALGLIPPAAVARLYSQLVSLPVASRDAPLLVLRARLSAALEKLRAAERQAQAAAQLERVNEAGPQFLSTFTGDDRLLVSEGSHTSFLAELDAQQAQQTTPMALSLLPG